MKNPRTALFLTLLISTTAFGVANAQGPDARAAFEQLKSLAGTWEGERQGEGEAEGEAADLAPEVTHVFQLAAAGTVLMETMNPGGGEEMINMYHLDGEALRVTHYCAGGNQPAMVLNSAVSTTEKLVFDFIGGTNLDPDVDNHIHSIEIELLAPDRIRSTFGAYSGGEPVGSMAFYLVRQ